MTFPLPSTALTDGVLVNEALLYSNVFVPLNTLGGFLYGESEGTSGNTVTIVSLNTNYIVPNAAVTFTLSTQRRVRVRTTARFQAATAPGTYTMAAFYVAGPTATLTSAVALGQAGANQLQLTNTAGNGAGTITAEHSVLLAAGQWTAFPVAVRTIGGAATDTAYFGYCSVYDAGNA